METFSDGQISDPTRAQYRTVPLRPHNVTFAPQSIGPTSFSVRWSGPIGISEFDRYQVRTGGQEDSQCEEGGGEDGYDEDLVTGRHWHPPEDSADHRARPAAGGALHGEPHTWWVECCLEN